MSHDTNPPEATGGGYLSVLRLPHALAVFVPALIARLSFAMVTLSTLFAVQRATDSFAIAGAATGLFGITNVVASPYRARIVDRYGQRRALITLAVTYGVLLGVLAVLTWQRAPVAAILVVSAVAGVLAPPVGAAMRVRWAELVPSPGLLTRAYSLDAVAEEILFTLGPLIIGALLLVAPPEIGLGLTALAVIAGTVGMTVGSHSRGHIPALSAAPRSLRPLRQRGFIPLLTVLLGVGIVLGSVDVAAPAFAEEHGSTLGAGILLAALSVGSAIGGLVYGRREWTLSLRGRLILFALLMGATSGLLALMPNVALLAIALAVVGLFLAPSLVTGYLSADSLTHLTVRTEASSWVNTAANLGAALAAAVGGVLVDSFSPKAAFAFGTITALVLVAVAAWRLGPLGKSQAASGAGDS